MRWAWLRGDGARLIADAAGALVWPEQSLLVVADLHLERKVDMAACLRVVDALVDAERA
ncbi:MAG TPA: hypothetical protein VE592_04590 [Geminicoccaceae bacterium]|jgi:metallophosphoesterase superfamily enzyme|nr:hypothetical protein [Geminicoccaceae bacterium]